MKDEKNHNADRNNINGKTVFCGGISPFSIEDYKEILDKKGTEIDINTE